MSEMREMQNFRVRHRLGGLVIAGLFVVASQFAWGEPQQAPRDQGAGKKRIAEVDANKDGMLSREEAGKLPQLAKRFDRVDTNHDGLLNKNEMHAARKQAQHFREKNHTTLRDMESESHQARIQILQQADACIKAASTPDAYRQCEQKERTARLALRESMKSRHEALMADARK